MKRVLALALAACPAGAALAQDPPICTDRPTKANAVCTVPAGRIQIEAGAIDWTVTDAGGARSELLTLGAMLVKVGLDDRSDLQIGFTPHAEVTVRGGGGRSRFSGIGDLVLRYKRRLTSAQSTVQVALLPFVKIPTAAEGLGNGRVEAGIALPISLAVSGSAAITFGSELDILADSDGRGRHVAVVNLVNVSAAIAPRLTLAGEVWTRLNFDRAGTVEQASVDAALAYAVSDNLQLDAGANVGLTDETPDVQAYVGFSVRF